MTSESTVVSLRQPDTIDDPLTAVLCSSARRLLAQAIEAEPPAGPTNARKSTIVRAAPPTRGR